MSARREKRRIESRESNSSKPASPVVQGEPAQRGRVLYIGDQGPIRTLVVSLLNVSGLGVVARSHGQRALATAQDDSFDVIVLDVAGTEPGDLGTLAHMAERTAPVITVSEGDDPIAIMREVQTGAIERVRKPVRPAELISTVDRVLALSQHEQASRRAMLVRTAGWYHALVSLSASARQAGAPGEDLATKRRWLSLNLSG